MKRMLAPLLLLLLIVLAPRLAPAGDGIECCLCVGCITGPATCVAPTLDCETICFNQLGCPGFTMGTGGECSAPPCDVTTPAPAPTMSHLGLIAMGIGLALVGLSRVTRRRSGAV